MKKKILISIILALMILCNIKVYATETEELPSKYDLRNDINIKVENQKDKPWCEYYSITKMIETYIQRTKGITYNLSEAYVAYYNEFGGTNRNQVLESDFPNKEYAITETNQKKYNEATEKAVVEDFEYLSNINKDINKVKEYIIKYGGAFSITMCDNQMDSYKGGIYRSNKSSENRGEHGVIIIGWDDNYSKDNFVYEKPQNNGAWLVLNTWGSSWGNKGTCWVSYEDYYNLVDDVEAIKSLTLSTGETIETELEEKEEQKEEINNIEQQIEEQPKKQNIFEMIANKMHLDEQDIMIICVLSALVLSVIIVTVIYCKKRKKTNNKKEADREKETEKELSLK